MRTRRIVSLLCLGVLILALAGCGINDTIRDKIKYDNNDPNGGSGISGGGYMEVAARFTPTELGPYNGRQIAGVEFWINAYGERDVTVRLYLYTAGSLTEGTMVKEKTETVRWGWRVIWFDTPYTINTSAGDLWVAYVTWTDSTLNPIGFDSALTPNPNGHFWRAPGGSWAVSGTGNYIIRAVL